MKILQNRWVVGALVVGAVALMIWQLWPVLFRPGRFRSAQASAPPVAAPSSTAAVPRIITPVEKPVAVQTSQPPAVRTSGVETSSVKVNVPRWTKTSDHDPFQVRALRGGIHGTNAPAREVLKLSAIWRQTGSALAIINGKLIGEGEKILKFKIEKIESDRVWVQGPDGREQLQFLGKTNNEPVIEPIPER